MTAIKTSRRVRWMSILGAVVCLLILATPAFAGGGNVPPSNAVLKGYTLTEAAASTAYSNDSLRTADMLSTLPADFQGGKFQMLYVPRDGPGNFSVAPGTPLYVPLAFSDSWDGTVPGLDYPDVNDPQDVSDYYFNPARLGAEYLKIEVKDWIKDEGRFEDAGKVTYLGPGYAVGTQTTGLSNGATGYTVAAAFLTPLSAGKHSVNISFRFSGAYIALAGLPGGVWEWETTYEVIVE